MATNFETSSSSPPPRKRKRDDDQCPRTINVTEFVADRALEITQLLAVVDNANLPCKEVAQGPRTFVQRLPRHMRRRAMSYNIKRLPRRMWSMAEATIKESKHRSKPPSRRWRRRPRNLLDAYVRRQRRVQWLETHIWHAKRFRMIDYFDWRLANRSCQRGFRASYRDASRHCVVQDQSYYVCFELRGTENRLIDRLGDLCQSRISQTFSNKKVLRGDFEGRATLYEPGSYPNDCLGSIRFMYRPKKIIDIDENRTLWIWAHPALEKKLTEIFKRIFQLDESSTSISDDDQNSIDRSIDNIDKFHASKLFSPPTYRSATVTMRILKQHLVRFRLIGPKSGSILSQILHQPTAIDYAPIFDDWKTEIDRQWHAWNEIYSRIDAATIDPNSILSLVVLDPRLFTDYKKRLPIDENRSAPNLPTAKSNWSDFPFWSSDVRRFALETKLSDYRLNEIRQNNRLRPGGAGAESISTENRNLVPILLIQQPSSNYRQHLGLGAGWDLILSAGWAMPFWIALQYATARAVGIDFQRHFALESIDQNLGFPRYWPDTECGRRFERDEADRAKNRYFGRPINRRIDYDRLRITHPFVCPWRELIDGWMKSTTTKIDTEIDIAKGTFFVFRDRIGLKKLEIDFGRSSKKKANERTIDDLASKFPRALIAVRLLSIGKGVPKSKALICLPTKEDLIKILAERTLNERESITKTGIDKGKSSDQKSIDQESTSQKSISALEIVDTEMDFIKLTSAKSIEETELNLETFFGDKKAERESERKRKEKERKKKKKTKKDDDGKNGGKAEIAEVKTADFDNIIDSCRRKILGYVVDGDFSFANGKGQAMGFCSLLGLKYLKDKNEFRSLVLYRNVQSKYYRAAVLSILNS